MSGAEWVRDKATPLDKFVAYVWILCLFVTVVGFAVAVVGVLIYYPIMGVLIIPTLGGACISYTIHRYREDTK